MKKTLLILMTFLSMITLRGQDNQDLDLSLQGQVMSDAGYNFNQVNPTYFDVMRPTQLPAYKNQYGSNGNVFFSVRQSMLGFRATVPTSKGPMKARFAFDLFGVGPNAGQTAFHLLYAWVEWWKFSAGWSWSQFCDFDVMPSIVEYWGPVGLSLCKNVMFCYVPIQGRNRLSFALERPGASADQGKYEDRIELTDVAPRFSVPDFSAEFRMTRDWGHVEAAGILRRIKWVDLGNQPYDLSGEALGWGLNLSSKLKIREGTWFKGQVIGGEGIENVMNDAPTDIAIETNYSNSVSPIKGVPLPLFSFSAYFDHRWSTKLTTSAGYSAIFIENTNGQQDDAFRQGHYASANLLYSPIRDLMAGVELQWIRRLNYNDGWSSSATRIQVSVRYNFSYSFSGKKM